MSPRRKRQSAIAAALVAATATVVVVTNRGPEMPPPPPPAPVMKAVGVVVPPPARVLALAWDRPRPDDPSYRFEVQMTTNVITDAMWRWMTTTPTNRLPLVTTNSRAFYRVRTVDTNGLTSDWGRT